MPATDTSGTASPAISPLFSAIMNQPVTDMSPTWPGSYRQPPFGPCAATAYASARRAGSACASALVMPRSSQAAIVAWACE